MICIKATIPIPLCGIDDGLKAIYHSKNTFCVWLFKSRAERNRFIEETVYMTKEKRQIHYEANFESVYLDWS